MLRYLSVGLLFLSSAAALAEGPSYSYIEGLYQEFDVDVGGGFDADGDGFTVAGSVAINDRWFVLVDYASADFDAGFDNLMVFRVAEHGAFPGRPHRNQSVGSLGYLPVNEAAECLLVDFAVAHRRYKRGN